MLYPPDIMHLIFFSKLLSIHKFEPIITKKWKNVRTCYTLHFFLHTLYPFPTFSLTDPCSKNQNTAPAEPDTPPAADARRPRCLS